MTGYTQPDLLPFPDDYNVPADVPADVEALAVATQAAVTRQDADITRLAPIGSIVMWPQASAPEGWHLCNGTAHGSTELQAVLGSTITPDLRDRFIVGAGGAYALKATGGAQSVTLGVANMPNHAHGSATGGQSDIHTHQMEAQPTYQGWNITGTDYGSWGLNTAPPGNTLQNSNDHTHAITGEGGGQEHENRPPYYALTYIIRKE